MWGWFDSSGRNMENNGLQPDVRVEHTDEDLSMDRDRQLEIAVETVLKQIPSTSAQGVPYRWNLKAWNPRTENPLFFQLDKGIGQR